MKLSMEVSVIAYRMTLVGNTLHEVRPPFGMAPEDEEGCLDRARGEGVEYDRRRVRVWAVVERERDGASGSVELGDGLAEQPAISMKGSVRGAAKNGGANA